MSEREPIEGTVARVLSTRELVINRGSEHGVTRGMVFEVLDDTGSDISDPETGDVIGSVYRPKVRVKVVVVEPRLAVAQTYRTRQKNVGGSGGIFGASDLARLMSGPPKWVEVPETFKTEEAAWEEISESNSFVKTGDPVREVMRRRQQGDEAEQSEPAVDPGS